MIPAKGYAAQNPEAELAPWNFQIREVGSHDLQIRIMYCGVCHTDLHQMKNDWYPGIFPMVPGHEIVGEVVKTGGHVKNSRWVTGPGLVRWSTPAESVTTVLTVTNNSVRKEQSGHIIAWAKTCAQPTAAMPIR